MGQCAAYLLCLSRTPSYTASWRTHTNVLHWLLPLCFDTWLYSEYRKHQQEGSREESQGILSGFQVPTPCRWTESHHVLSESLKINPSSCQVGSFTVSLNLDFRNHTVPIACHSLRAPAWVCRVFFSEIFIVSKQLYLSLKISLFKFTFSLYNNVQYMTYLIYMYVLLVLLLT